MPDVRTFYKLKDRLPQEGTIAIAGHERPDGDCIGSCTALYLYIRKVCPKCKVILYLEERKSCFSYLPGVNMAETVYHHEPVDLLIVADTASPQRIGVAKDLIEEAKSVVCIDHHVSNPAFGDDNYILPDKSSTCEVLYDLLDEDVIDQEIALLLYCGLVHDTGCFSYPSTSDKTLTIAAHLMSFGLDAPYLIDHTFRERSFAENKAMGYLYDHAELFAEGRGICATCSREELEQFGVRAMDLDFVIAELRNTAGVEAAVFIYPTEEHWKASLRSKTSLDVSAIAQSFGGGGHVHAAGCSLEGSLIDVKTRILTAMEDAMCRSDLI